MSYLIKQSGYRARGAAAGALLGAASGAGLKAYYNKQLGKEWNHNLGGSALTGAAVGGAGGFVVGRGLAKGRARHEAEMAKLDQYEKELDKKIKQTTEDIEHAERYSELLNQYRGATPGTEESAAASASLARHVGADTITNLDELNHIMTRTSGAPRQRDQNMNNKRLKDVLKSFRRR